MYLVKACEALNSVETKLTIKEENHYQGSGASTVRW